MSEMLWACSLQIMIINVTRVKLNDISDCYTSSIQSGMILRPLVFALDIFVKIPQEVMGQMRRMDLWREPDLPEETDQSSSATGMEDLFHIQPLMSEWHTHPMF